MCFAQPRPFIVKTGLVLPTGTARSLLGGVSMVALRDVPGFIGAIDAAVQRPLEPGFFERSRSGLISYSHGMHLS